MMPIRKLIGEQLIMPYREEKWKVLLKICKENNVKTMLEIGTWKGITLHELTKRHKFENVITIDPYEPNAYIDKTRDKATLSKREFRKAEEKARKLLIGKALMIKATSKKAKDIIGNYKFDLIFIDGDHTYEAVKEDIETWKNNCKILTGDDFTWNHKGVIKAVLEKYTLDNIELLPTGIWMRKK